ncbi:MAG: aminotransferase, partial [Lachnospiraceae bacterium]|nr:aminotransferase [Lachnospiraceae bacterium]
AACRALDELQEEGILSYNKPHAAFYVFPRIDDHIHIKNDRQMAFDLLEQKHILLVAGSGFDWIDMQHFRLVLLPEPDQLYKAVKDIGDFLRDYRQ